MKSSLEVYNSNGKIFFERDGKWLHPLFALIEYLKDYNTDVSSYILHDKIIGAAAAVLIIKMGFKKCHGILISKKAVKLFDRHNVNYTYGKLVDGILCKTEKIIELQKDINLSYELLINIKNKK